MIRTQNPRSVPRIPTQRLKLLGQIICDALGCKNYELSIVITDDSEIHALNRTWRKKDKPTDVLSFPQAESSDKIALSHSRRLLLGDVVISRDTAARQAESFGHAYEHELQRLLIHGVLHLLGYEHAHGGRQAA